MNNNTRLTEALRQELPSLPVLAHSIATGERIYQNDSEVPQGLFCSLNRIKQAYFSIGVILSVNELANGLINLTSKKKTYVRF